jgi:hypothetical protein
MNYQRDEWPFTVATPVETRAVNLGVVKGRPKTKSRHNWLGVNDPDWWFVGCGHT